MPMMITITVTICFARPSIGRRLTRYNTSMTTTNVMRAPIRVFIRSPFKKIDRKRPCSHRHPAIRGERLVPSVVDYSVVTGVGGFRSAATFTIRRSIGFKSNKLILIFLENKHQRSSPANALTDDPRLIGAPKGIHSVRRADSAPDMPSRELQEGRRRCS